MSAARAAAGVQLRASRRLLGREGGGGRRTGRDVRRPKTKWAPGLGRLLPSCRAGYGASWSRSGRAADSSSRFPGRPSGVPGTRQALGFSLPQWP